MKIATSTLAMAAQHSASKEYTLSQNLRSWKTDISSPTAPSTTVSLQGKSADQIRDDLNDQIEHDPHLSLIRQVLEFLTGQKIQVVHSTQAGTKPPSQPTASSSAVPILAPGMAYDVQETYQEQESTSLSAEGTVNTADGRQIHFSLNLSMQRSYIAQSSLHIEAGAPQKKDPLVLNFNGRAAQLTDQRFRFDLDADGKEENIATLAAGSGYLAFDRNGDGKINNGQELFGARTGNGFSELAAFDDDGNGWIDENDAAYQQLKIWQKTADGADQLQGLAQMGVGAIALSNISTAFDLKNAANMLQGSIANTGIFLRENGEAGTIQKIDLAV